MWFLGIYIEGVDVLDVFGIDGVGFLGVWFLEFLLLEFVFREKRKLICLEMWCIFICWGLLFIDERVYFWWK